MPSFENKKLTPEKLEKNETTASLSSLTHDIPDFSQKKLEYGKKQNIDAPHQNSNSDVNAPPKKEIWEETGRFSLPEQGSNKHLDDDFWSGNQKNDSLQESNIKQAQNIPDQKIDSATPSLEKAKDNASSEANDMQKSDVSENKATGGTYGELKSEWKGELEKEPPHEVHHMPANDVNELDLNDGPAIVMDKADHRQTASCGNSVEAREYREKQKELIENGKFEEAMQMDIDDIHDKFGNKYDEAIAQMKQKAKEKGLI